MNTSHYDGPPVEEIFATPVSGPSYGKGAKGVAIAITVLSVGTLLASWRAASEAGLPALVMLLAACAAMIVMCWSICNGRTVIDAEGIRQDWLFPKKYGWNEVHRAKLLRLPLATRLLINNGRPPFKAVHGGTPQLVAAFERIVETLPRGL